YAATARLTGSAARYAWAVVVAAAGLSGLAQAAWLAADGLAAAPLLRFGIGAWPAFAAAVVAHLLYLLIDPTPRTNTALDTPAVPSEPVSTPPSNAIPEPAPDTGGQELSIPPSRSPSNRGPSDPDTDTRHAPRHRAPVQPGEARAR